MTKELDFISPCPVDQCKNKDKKYRWTHNQCGGRLTLNDKGMLRCLKCGTQGPFMDWPFNCGDHDYKYCSIQGICHAFSFVTRVLNNEKVPRIIIVAIYTIFEEFKERPEIEMNSRLNLDGEEYNGIPFQNVEEETEDTEQHINMLLGKSKILGGVLGLIAMLFSFVKGDFPNALGGFLTLLGLMMIKQFRNQKELIKALLYMIIGLFVYDIIWLRIYGGSCWNKHDRGTGGNENGLLIASFFITIINEVLKGMLGFSLWVASTKA